MMPTGQPATAPGYAWLYVLEQEKSHQFPTPVVPDEEDVLTARCGSTAMAFRVLDGYQLPVCFECLVAHGSAEADQQEAAGVGSSDRVMF